jgi:hypothetical protein
VKVLFNLNRKTLLKEIEKDTRRWRYLACLLIGRINIVKMAVLLKAIYTFNVILIKLPMSISVEKEKLILQYI